MLDEASRLLDRLRNSVDGSIPVTNTPGKPGLKTVLA